MDGAVVLTHRRLRILRAATHLMPDPAHPDRGVRHPAPHRPAGRAADRLPGHLGVAVDADHQPVHRRSPLRAREHRRAARRAPTRRSPRSSATSPGWTRCRTRCPRSRSRTSSPCATPPSSSQRLEMVRRIADEVTGQVVELGTDGRLLALQLDELMAGVDADRDLIARDYLPAGRRGRTSSRCSSTSPTCPPPTCSTSPRSRGRWACPAPPRHWTARRARADTGCWRGCPGCRAPSSTGSSSTSAACRSCSPRRSRIFRSSTASARPGPAPSARDLASGRGLDHRPLSVADAARVSVGGRCLSRAATQARYGVIRTWPAWPASDPAGRAACRCPRRPVAGFPRSAAAMSAPSTRIERRTSFVDRQRAVGARLDGAVVAAPHPRLAVVDEHLDLRVREVRHCTRPADVGHLDLQVGVARRPGSTSCDPCHDRSSTGRRAGRRRRGRRRRAASVRPSCGWG